jgi:glycosyltransferase involved in cell wall biosynthesis
MKLTPHPLPALDLSVVVPFFNEEENLPLLVGEIEAALAGQAWQYEVLLVDDGSTDGSLEALEKALGERTAPERFRVLRLRRNSGQSAALCVGFRAARGDLVVTLDADLQNDPADIPAVVAALTDHDLVSGIRVNRQDTASRRLASRIANRVRSWVIGDGIHDVGCSLKAYRRELLEDLPTFHGMHRFLPALVQMRGARVREIPVNHRPRCHGESKYTIGNRLARTVADLAAVRWMQSRWFHPHVLLAEGVEVEPEQTAEHPELEKGASGVEQA